MPKLLLTLLVYVLCVANVRAEAPPAAETSTAPQEQSAGEPQNWQHLQTLVDTIATTRTRQAEVRAELRATEDEHERERLEQEADQLSADLESLQTAWEMLATGGADIRLFGVKTEQAFNWRAELQSVFEPILVELKKLTERPRKIERLRNEQSYYQERLEVAEAALESITTYRTSAPSGELGDAFLVLENRWRKRRDDLKNRLALIEFELQEVLAPTKAGQKDPVDSLKELLSGRLLNLVMAVLVMVAAYLFMRWASRSYNRFIMRKTAGRPAFVARVGNLIFYLLTALMVLFAGMAVLYVRGDWLLLGLFLIALAGAALTIQRTLPSMLTEAKLMLNLGPVREGERIVFEGIPWRVRSLSFYASLENPLLQGGVLQIPVKSLLDHHSRRFANNEPWFPTQVGDYVILGDNTFGKVLLQTPEIVQLQVLDSIKSYGAAAFLDEKPRNISLQGFTLTMSFGVDYAHQNEVTSSIRERLERALDEGLRASEVAPHLRNFRVEFQLAGASSLDLLAIAGFAGDAAGSYFKITRLMQRLAVDACNANGWVIPFNQMTVHLERSE